MKRLFFILFVVISASSYGQKIYPDSSFYWRRLGIVFSDSANRNFEAPTVKFEGNPQLYTGLTNVWKIWFTYIDGSGVPNIGYAESPDGIGNWHRINGLISNHRSSSVFEKGSTYYCYAASTINGTQIDQYTSSNGVSWTLANSAVISKGTGGQWNSGGVYNSWVDTIGTTWFMLLDGQNTSTYGFSDGLYTSTDGVGAVWTPYSGNPVLPFLTSPFWKRVGNTIWAWGGTQKVNAILPTDIVRFNSGLTMQTWTQNPLFTVFHRETAAEGVNSNVGQVQDMCDVQVVVSAGDTLVYRYCLAVVNGNNSGGAKIELSIYNGSWYQLINGNENAPRNFVFDNNGSNIYTSIPIGFGTPATSMIGSIDVEPIYGQDSANATIATGNLVANLGNGQLVISNNAQFSSRIGYNAVNAANVSYAQVFTTSGVTNYFAAAGQDLTLINMGSWTYNGTNAIYNFGTVAAPPRIFMDGAVDDGSGMGAQFSTGLSVTNIKMTSQLNGLFYNDHNGTVVNSSFVVSSTKNFGSGTYTGTDNVFLNTQNTAATTATQDVVIGFGAGTGCTTCSFNTLIGEGVGPALTTGGSNALVGRDALIGATTQGNFSGVGAEILRSVGTGSGWGEALGYAAGWQDVWQSTFANADSFTLIGHLSQAQCNGCGIFGGVNTNAERWGFGTYAPRSWLDLEQGMGVKGYSAIRFKLNTVQTTALAGNGATMTYTFAAQPYPPYRPTQLVDVSGGAPSGYNVTGASVVACTTTTLTIAGTATGSQTSAATILADGVPAVGDSSAFGVRKDTLFFRDMDGNSYKLNFPSGTTPTLQQVLTAGSTLTGANTVIQGNNALTISGGQFVLGNISNTRTWDPNTALLGSIFSIQSGTLNDATTAASGTVANAYVSGITSPTLSATNTGVVYTNAFSLWVNAAPVAGTNVTITNAYAFGVTGNSLFQGNISASSVNLTGSADLTGQTAAVTVTSYAVPGSTTFNTFRVGGYITVTAVSLDVIQLQVTWTDETSTSRTQSFFVQGATTGVSVTGANGYSPIDIRVKKGTTITVATALTTGTGSITYDAGANITQLY